MVQRTINELDAKFEPVRVVGKTEAGSDKYSYRITITKPKYRKLSGEWVLKSSHEGVYVFEKLRK